MQLEHARGLHLSPPHLPLSTNPNCYNQSAICQGIQRKKEQAQTQPTFKSSNATYLYWWCHPQSYWFFSSNTFNCKKATESSVPIPESLTIDCFSVAFLWCHILSVFTLQCFKFKQKGWSYLYSVSVTCCLCYMKTWRNLNPLRLKKPKLNPT